MTLFNALQTKILAALADGGCQSGESLGVAFSVSRAAIWKQIHALINKGLRIECLANGYQLLQPYLALDSTRVEAELPPLLQNVFTYHFFDSIDSTNRYLKDLPPGGAAICCAEQQLQGRGRFGRTWFSPFGENIYFSGRWILNCPLHRLGGLSIVISLAVLDCLRQFQLHHGVNIKWPNDLLWHDKKLCGVLVEINAESNNNAQVVIGVGLNVNSTKERFANLSRTATSLAEMAERFFDRNILLAALITSIDRYITQFLAEEFSFFVKQWQLVDYLCGKNVVIHQFGKNISGKACGIDERGQLLVVDPQGKYHFIAAGEASLASNEFMS